MTEEPNNMFVRTLKCRKGRLFPSFSSAEYVGILFVLAQRWLIRGEQMRVLNELQRSKFLFVCHLLFHTRFHLLLSISIHHYSWKKGFILRTYWNQRPCGTQNILICTNIIYAMCRERRRVVMTRCNMSINGATWMGGTLKSSSVILAPRVLSLFRGGGLRTSLTRRAMLAGVLYSW